MKLRKPLISLQCTLMALLVVLSAIITGCKKTSTPNSEQVTQEPIWFAAAENEPVIGAMVDRMPATDEAKISLPELTHLLTAEFVGFNGNEAWPYFMFKPIEVFRGELNEGEQENLYVIASDELRDSTTNKVKVPYDEGKVYLLPLQKYTSVYIPHAYFGHVDPENPIPSDSESWDELIVIAKKVGDGLGLKVTPGCRPFTTSEDVGEILDFCNTAIVVKIDSEDGGNGYRMRYNCTVSRVLKGKANLGEKIPVLFFSDTVKVGGEYVVLLYASVGAKEAAYCLAAPKNCVYTLDEALAVPELAELLSDE